MTSAMVCPSCTLGENGAICLVVFQTAEILGLIIRFAIHFLCVTFPMRDTRGKVYDLSFGMYFLYSVLENGAIGLVLLQTAEILGLMICFAIHFLCVTIE